MPDYEAALRVLKQRYLTRLGHSIQAIDNILLQRQLGPLTKDDLRRAQSLAHGLAGSGAIFDFPAITRSGQTADRLLDDIITHLPEGGHADDAQFAALNTALLDLRVVCEAALQGETITKEPPAAPPHTPHIHIIDDDPELSAMVALELHRDRYAVVVSADGEAAMRAIRKRAPDLIILDISLPQMSGHEVLRHLKQDPEFITIPVLMLTGREDRTDFIKALHSGALDYLVKPFDLQKLRARVRKILNAAQFNPDSD